VTQRAASRTSTAKRRETSPSPTTSSFRAPRYESPPADGSSTFGPLVCWWIEKVLRHGEGDSFGKPIVLDPFQRYIVDRIYEFWPDTGELCHNRILIGVGKGNSKTELLGDIGDAELAGPIAPVSPNVSISAASYEQADKVFGAAKTGALEGDLGPFVDAFETEMQLRGKPGIMRRIAAVAGTNDGGLETCHIGDEVHEWLGERASRVWTILGNSLKKRVPRSANPTLKVQRVGALQIGITTAGDDKDTLLGRLYEHGKRVASGEIVDPGFLFMWWEADPKWDLEDAGQLRAAVLEANPAAGSFLSTANLLGRYVELKAEGKVHEFRRYHLNQWVSSPLDWVAHDLIDASFRIPGKQAPPPKRGTSIVLGFDGSNNRDATALIGWTVDSDYGFVVDAWEPSDGEAVSRTEVDAAVHRAFSTWDVLELAGDPPGWRTELETWEAEFGTRELDEAHDRVMGSGKVLRFATFQYARFGPACAEFKTAMLTGGPEIDGHPILVRHLKNAQAYDTRHGQVIVKDSKTSPRKIDAADAAIIARHRSRWWARKRLKEKQAKRTPSVAAF
jgi:phage terminase large subunit-like protein